MTLNDINSKKADSINRMLDWLTSHGHDAVLGACWDQPTAGLLEEGKNGKEEYGFLILEDINGSQESQIFNSYRWTYVNNITGLIIASDLNPEASCEEVCDFLASEDALLLKYRTEEESGE